MTLSGDSLLRLTKCPNISPVVLNVPEAMYIKLEQPPLKGLVYKNHLSHSFTILQPFALTCDPDGNLMVKLDSDWCASLKVRLHTLETPAMPVRTDWLEMTRGYTCHRHANAWGQTLSEIGTRFGLIVLLSNKHPDQIHMKMPPSDNMIHWSRCCAALTIKLALVHKKQLMFPRLQ